MWFGGALVDEPMGKEHGSEGEGTAPQSLQYLIQICLTAGVIVLSDRPTPYSSINSFLRDACVENVEWLRSTAQNVCPSRVCCRRSHSSSRPTSRFPITPPKYAMTGSVLICAW